MTKIIRSLQDLSFADFLRQKESGSGLPFVHFTILSGRYPDGTEKSTGVTEDIKSQGIKQNTSAIEIDKNNIEDSLKTAFQNFAHHAVRTNRGLTWTTNQYEKPDSVIPGVVIINNIGQINKDKKKTIDAPGHVWLHSTGPETILSIQPLTDYYVNGNDPSFSNNKTALTNLINVYKRMI